MSGINETRWENAEELPSLEYTCGFCSRDVVSTRGYRGGVEYDMDETQTEPKEYGYARSSYIYICGNRKCNMPSVIGIQEIMEIKDSDEIAYQKPEPKKEPGGDILGLNDEIKMVYQEARKCVSVGAWTATAMLCRKILMNISVSEGATGKKSFAEHVNHLIGSGLIPKNWKDFVEETRDTGNAANHEVKPTTRAQALKIFEFVQFMLESVYGLPHKFEKINKPPRTGKEKK